MCVHNAKRDDCLLMPSAVTGDNTLRYFNPATGQFENTKPVKISSSPTRKNTRGRAKSPSVASRGSNMDALAEAAE